VTGRVEVLQECASTNIEAADRDRFAHGDAVVALNQTAGRGQRGHKWDSRPGENLMFSLVLEPDFLPAARQFLLSEAVALGIADALDGFGVRAGIKWTNDIYVGDRKICGTLIENDLGGGNLARSIVGVGINVNQTEFPEWIPNPDSLRLETGRTYRLQEVFRAVYDCIGERYGMLAAGGYGRIEEDYAARLYRRDSVHRYFIPGEGEVEGIIRGVRADGALRVEIDGRVREFLFREIEFIL